MLFLNSFQAKSYLVVQKLKQYYVVLFNNYLLICYKVNSFNTSWSYSYGGRRNYIIITFSIYFLVIMSSLINLKTRVVLQ